MEKQTDDYKKMIALVFKGCLCILLLILFLNGYAKQSENLELASISITSRSSTHSDFQSESERISVRSEPLDTPTYIEPGFIDLLKNSLDRDEYDLLPDLVSDKRLTKEEGYEITSDELTEFLTERWEKAERQVELYPEIIKVDADNDGIDDIVVYWHIGGNARFAKLEFYKGYENETYKNTYSSGFGLHARNTFVNYNGKNYFLFNFMDYNRKVICGFEVYYFENGIAVERAIIQKTASSYTLADKTIISDNYNTLADELSDIAQTIYFDQKNVNVIGSGEKELSGKEKEEASTLLKDVVTSWYSSDIDNDGILEIYSKGRNLPTTFATIVGMSFNLFKDSERYDLKEKFGLNFWGSDRGERAPQYLWVENIDNKNIICVLSTLAFGYSDIAKDDFQIDCYYLYNDSYQTVVSLIFSPEYNTTTEIYTHDINRDFIKSGATFDGGKG